MSERFIQINEEGLFHFSGQLVSDEAYGHGLLKELHYNDEGKLLTALDGQVATVEYFDAPLIVKQIFRHNDRWELLMPYDFRAEWQIESLCLDEWDRFHGFTQKGIPFVFSRAAQNEFFNLVDSFDDEAVTISGREIATPSWFVENSEVLAPEFWGEIYNRDDAPPWELGEAHNALADSLAQIKIPRSRVAVLGCGSGNDAAFLAEQGHLVTGFDMSREAIGQAQEKYGHLKSLQFVEGDIFNLDKKFFGQFDLVFEHTCYCAIPPNRRNDLTRVWRQLLAPGGHLLGVFFVMEKRVGPPYGGSEWEIRERLKKNFDFYYWTRWQKSPVERRQGKELVVYAKSKTIDS